MEISTPRKDFVKKTTKAANINPNSPRTKQALSELGMTMSAFETKFLFFLIKLNILELQTLSTVHPFCRKLKNYVLNTIKKDLRVFF